MTQTAKTLLGGIGVFVLVLALIAVANRNVSDNLEQAGEAGTIATSTPEVSIDKGPETATTSGSIPATPTRQATACRNAGGTWDGSHNECTGISEGSCKAAGGAWNGCASPCRNNPNAEACIQMCVEVCTIR